MTHDREVGFTWLVYPIAVAQLVLWGTIYSSFTLFIGPMRDDLGLSTADASGVFSLGLLVSGLLAIPIGHWIDRHGGFWPLVGGSFLSVLCFVIWSRVGDYRGLALTWCGMGVAMSAVLTQPAYAVLVQNLGDQSRRGITVSTFFTGFSATVFVPLTSYLIHSLGWRPTLIVLAGLSLLCTGIHAFAVPRLPADLGPNEIAPPASADAGTPATSPYRLVLSRSFWGVIIAFALNASTTTIMAVLLIPLLRERGYELAVAVTAVALVGPAQIGARFILAFGRFKSFSAHAIGVIALSLKFVAMTSLLFCDNTAWSSWMVFPFAILNGLAGGAILIVLAIITTELFGTKDYAAIQGGIQTVITLTRAAAPVVAASLWSARRGADLLIWVLIGLALTSLLSLAAVRKPGSAAKSTEPRRVETDGRTIGWSGGR